MIVVGFDPGMVAGLACVELGGPMPPRLVDAQRVPAGDAALPIDRRLQRVWGALGAMLREHHPFCLGIEEQSGAQVGAFHRGDFNVDNSKTMICVGMAVGCALAYRVPVVWVKPQQAKIAVCGKGGRSADKHQVKRAVAAIVGKELPEAAADAVAIALVAGRLHRERRAA